MTLTTPPEFLTEVCTSLSTTRGPDHKSFTLHEIETIVGKLNHISLAALWLKFILVQVYVSIASALHYSKAHLIHTNASFRAILKALKIQPLHSDTTAHSSF